jgi:hypothetical protein
VSMIVMHQALHVPEACLRSSGMMKSAYSIFFEVIVSTN